MSFPISPAPTLGSVGNELPAYVANGVIGLRVRDMALGAGMTLVSGYSGSIHKDISRPSPSRLIPSPGTSKSEEPGCQMRSTPSP